jgi:hypothetical protein
MLRAKIIHMSIVMKTVSRSNVTVTVFLFGMFSMECWKNVPVSLTYLYVITSELQFEEIVCRELH